MYIRCHAVNNIVHVQLFKIDVLILLHNDPERDLKVYEADLRGTPQYKLFVGLVITE
jgi:hypothetical protein